MDYGSDCAYGCYGVFCLPNVSPKVYTYGTFLHAIVDELENFQLRIDFWSACDYHWHWTAINDLVKVLNPNGPSLPQRLA